MLVIKNARLSYANIWEPKSINGSEPKYSVSLLIDKKDTAMIAAINAAIEKALEEGIQSKFSGKKPANLKMPLRDGDIEFPDDKNYAGCYFFNANSKTAPKIVDRKVQPIIDQDEVYSGCYANVSVSFFAFNASGNKGVGAGLHNIQKVKDGERLGGGTTPEEDFEPLGDDFLD